MTRFLLLFAMVCSTTAFAVPGAKKNHGTILPAKSPEAKSEMAASSLGDFYALVGTISCDSCASPFQPVAVVRELAGQKLLHLRVGDELSLSSGEHTVVTVIATGAVEFKGAYGSYRLRAGGFPDEAAQDATMIATKPQSYSPPPANGVRW